MADGSHTRHCPFEICIACAELWSVHCRMRLSTDTRLYRSQPSCTRRLHAWWSCKATPQGEFFGVEGWTRLLHSRQLWGA